MAVVLPLAAACGSGGGDGAAIIARAQNGLRHLGSTPVHVKVSVQGPIPIERSFDVSAEQLSRLELTRWTKKPRRISCSDGLECARADVDVAAALSALGPRLPALPIRAGDIRNAQIDCAVDNNGRTRYLHLRGDVHAGLGSMPFEADLDIPPSRRA